MFSNIAHPVDKISTVGQIGSILSIGGWRDEFNLTFSHIDVQIFCTNAKNLIYGCLCDTKNRLLDDDVQKAS